MHDPVVVRVPHGVGHLLEQTNPLGQRQVACHLGEVLALDVLHRDEGHRIAVIVGVLTHLVHPNDPRMGQAGRQARFTQHTHRRLGIPTRSKHLQRHDTLQLGIHRLINHPHATASNLGDQLIATNLALGGQPQLVLVFLPQQLRNLLAIQQPLLQKALRQVVNPRRTRGHIRQVVQTTIHLFFRAQTACDDNLCQPLFGGGSQRL